MSFHLNSVNPNLNQIVKTQRIYLDPEHLIALKNRRKAFNLVPSIYQPPEQEIPFKNHSSWSKTTDYSRTKHQILNKNQLNFSKNVFSNDNEMLPEQKIKILQQILEQQAITPNVEFVWKLIPASFKRQIINFQQGDCIPLNSGTNQKFLILSGQVRVIGVNDHQFKRQAGFLFFLSHQTHKKIKQIVVLRLTKLLIIPNQIYQSLIKNYFYLKHSEKIKYIQFCPFFIWKDKLTEDLAACMELRLTQKQEIVYQANSHPDAIYFVKEGIVLLERNTKIKNPIIADYEQHYEKNQISQKDTILVVRKGMTFGIDGIVIKQFSSPEFQQTQQIILKQQITKQIQQNQSQKQKEQIAIDEQNQNPEKLIIHKSSVRKNSRVYTAKTLGKCELYCLDRKILQTLFSISDISEQMCIKRRQIASSELERMSIEYTNMLLATHSMSPFVALRKKQLVLKISNCSQQEATRSNSQFAVSIRSYSFEKKYKSSKSPKTFKLKYKNFTSQQNLKLKEKFKNQLYIKDAREENQLKKWAASLKSKQKLQISKNLKNNEKLKVKKQNSEAFILPKIANCQRQGILNYQSSPQQKQKGKLNEIINSKIKEQLKLYPKTKASDLSIKVKPVALQQQNHHQSLLYKLLQQNHKSNGNPSFINIKSYKSIITGYDFSK